MIVHPRHQGGRHRARRAVFLFALGALVCGGAYYLATKRAAPAPAPAPASQSQAYTVRGQIAQLPDPARPSSTFDIRHEPITDFQRKDGTLGMAAMTMSFPIAPGVSLEGLAVGDKVDFTFEVDWSGSPIFQITRIARLPAETELNFSAPTQPGK